MKENKIYTSFEELEREIQIAKLERLLAEEKFKKGIHSVKRQFYPNILSQGLIKDIGRHLLPIALQWGLRKLRKA